MSTPRSVMADRLRASLPATIRVEDYARVIDAPSRPTVMVRLDEVLRHPESPAMHRLYRATVIVLTAKVNPHGSADDDLDLHLEEVLAALDEDDTIHWTRAARGVWLDTSLPAYEVAVEVTHQKGPTP